MRTSRIAWTLWAVVPVLALTYHFGPGQRYAKQSRAARVLENARLLQDEATRAQGVAYEAHLEAIRARFAVSTNDDPTHRLDATRAGEAESETAARAAEAWKRTADSIGAAVALLADSPAEIRDTVRIGRAHALVRAGAISDGASELITILDHPSTPTAGAQAREELATAYYYAARLLRASGSPADEWREAAARARQNFRYLAETAPSAEPGAEPLASTLDNQRNVELVLNLEQSAADDLYAKPRPREAPGMCNGKGMKQLLGKKRGRKGPGKPDTDQGAGAGFDGEIGEGW